MAGAGWGQRERTARYALRAMLLVPLLACTACRQQMAEQPRYKPLERSTFFADGLSARPLEPGTVARGHLRADPWFYRGLRPAGGGQEKPGAGQSALADPLSKMPIREAFATEFPVPLTRDLLVRGRERYGIYCAMCHDPLGYGRGTIVERGFTPPPSFHGDPSRGLSVPLREAPVGYIFHVISNGYGAMPSYDSQVPPPDRWAIIGYIRALQLSQNVKLSDLPEAERRRAETELKGK
jgi:mono/diheme cytochrome c family protein